MSAETTIIIVNWNTREMLLECLHGIGDEGPVVVVDNGSADGSADAVAEAYPDVTLIRNETNLGFARANNQALEQLKTPFALLLNSDAFPEPDAIATVAAYMESEPQVGVLGAKLLNTDGTMQNSYDNEPTLATELLNKSLLKKLCPTRYPGKEAGFTEPTELESVIGAFMLLRKEALDRVGLLDEDYFFFKEETDLCLRMRRAGWKVVHHPGVRVVHRQGQSKALAPLAAKIEYDRSNILFFRKHRSPGALALLRAGRIAKLAANLLLGGIGILLTAGGSARIRRRTATYAGLLGWHLQGCPDGPGLRDRQPGDEE